MPYAGEDFSPRNIGEKPLLDMDFGLNLRAGETISSASVELSVESGSDAAPQSRVDGAATVSGSIVTQQFDFDSAAIGSPTTYLASFIAVTSLGQTLIGWSRIPVVTAGESA